MVNLFKSLIKPTWHCIAFSPLEGHPRRHFNTFSCTMGHPRGHYHALSTIGASKRALFCCIMGNYTRRAVCNTETTMTPVAVKSTAVSILSLAFGQNSDVSHTRLNMIDRHHVDSLLAVYCCLSSFHREAQQRQQSYISWMKTLTRVNHIVNVLPVSSCESVLCCVPIVA